MLYLEPIMCSMKQKLGWVAKMSGPQISRIVTPDSLSQFHELGYPNLATQDVFICLRLKAESLPSDGNIMATKAFGRKFGVNTGVFEYLL